MTTSEELIKLITKDSTASKVFATLERLGLIDRSACINIEDYKNIKITNLGLAVMNTTSLVVDVSWIDEYRNLFKAKNVTKIGVKQSVISKMTTFLQKNNYTKEDVIKATSMYLDNLQGYGDHQMAAADYFIYFTDPSLDPVSGTKTVKSQLLKWIEISKEDLNLNKGEFITKL